VAVNGSRFPSLPLAVVTTFVESGTGPVVTVMDPLPAVMVPVAVQETLLTGMVSLPETKLGPKALTSSVQVREGRAPVILINALTGEFAGITGEALGFEAANVSEG
jgi:hypothetical protein